MKIELKFNVGNEVKKLKLLRWEDQPGVVQIYLDDHYNGVLRYSLGEWVAHLVKDSELSSEDITLIKETVIKNDFS